MRLIIGLGNPGQEHQNNRHNLGFMAVEEFSAKCKVQSAKWEYNKKLKSEIFKAQDLIIAKPQTYMNNSGLATSLAMGYYKIKPEDLIVVYDELDLPLGKIKIRMGGAAAGHHGVESIIQALQTDKFIRVRLGIGNERTQSAEHGGQNIDVNRYVLSPFNTHEKSQLKHMLKQAAHALDALLEKGLEVAQNQYH